MYVTVEAKVLMWWLSQILTSLVWVGSKLKLVLGRHLKWKLEILKKPVTCMSLSLQIKLNGLMLRHFSQKYFFINRRLSLFSTARGSSARFSLVGPTKVKACKSYISKSSGNLEPRIGTMSRKLTSLNSRS